MSDFTPEQKDRLVTLIFDPSPITTAVQAVVGRMYGYAERVACVTDWDVALGTKPRRTWPLRARLVDWTAGGLDDLGLWANAHRARRRRR